MATRGECARCPCVGPLQRVGRLRLCSWCVEAFEQWARKRVRFTRAIAYGGLPLIFAELAGCDGRVSVLALARHTGKTPTQAKESLQYLVRKGLARRVAKNVYAPVVESEAAE